MKVKANAKSRQSKRDAVKYGAQWARTEENKARRLARSQRRAESAPPQAPAPRLVPTLRGACSAWIRETLRGGKAVLV